MEKRVTSGSRFSAKGFSIVEVLVVLALIALLSGMFATSFDTLLSNFTDKPPERQLHEWTRRARSLALNSGKPHFVRLSDDRSGLVLVGEGQDTAIETMTWEEGFSIGLAIAQPTESLGTSRIQDFLYEDVDGLRFEPDGSTGLARISLLEDGELRELYLSPLRADLITGKGYGDESRS